MKAKIELKISIYTKVYTHEDGRVGVQTLFDSDGMNATCQCIDGENCTQEEFSIFMNESKKVFRMGIPQPK